jgi:serine/threonine protein kinase
MSPFAGPEKGHTRFPGLWASARIMNTVRHCAGCSAPLPADAPEGLCPQCRETKAKAPHREEAPTPAELAQHFPQLELLELIGKGGMGIVYKARQPRLDRLVALKILPAGLGGDAAFAERFAREARAMAKLNHPGIVTIYDFGHTGILYYFVMEFVEGTDLRELMAQGQVKPATALGLVMQICEALQFAHEQGVIHRDIKPGNILLDQSGRVKIADFGLAKLVRPSAADVSLTGTQHVMGTPQYMAPEQMSDPQAVDHRADIYALGVVFYELLTGALPVGRFAPPSQRVKVDVRLDEVVLRALEQEPARRYQHAGDVKTDVQAIQPEGEGSPSRPGRSPRLRPFAVAALGLLLLAGAGGILWPRGAATTIRENPPSFGHVSRDARWCDYAVEAPVNHRVNFWLEWWKQGRRVELPDFALAESFTPARGHRFKGYADLVIWKHNPIEQPETNRIKWQWSLRGSDALSSRASYAVDPFEGLELTDSSYGYRPGRKVKTGEELTLLVVRGCRNKLVGQPWDPKMTGRADVEMHLKTRIDSVPEEELREVPQTNVMVQLGGRVKVRP